MSHRLFTRHFGAQTFDLLLSFFIILVGCILWEIVGLLLWNLGLECHHNLAEGFNLSKDFANKLQYLNRECLEKGAHIKTGLKKGILRKGVLKNASF